MWIASKPVCHFGNWRGSSMITGIMIFHANLGYSRRQLISEVIVVKWVFCLFIHFNEYYKRAWDWSCITQQSMAEYCSLIKFNGLIGYRWQPPIDLLQVFLLIIPIHQNLEKFKLTIISMSIWINITDGMFLRERLYNHVNILKNL